MSRHRARPGGRGLLLDRDGTVTAEVGHVADPARLAVLPGAAAAIRRARSAGFRVALVTNQSGVARGLFREEDVAAFHAALVARLAAEGAGVDRVLVCPHHPAGAVEAYRRACDCRKPAPGLVHRAIAELALSPVATFVVGDRARDVVAGRAAGVRAVGVRTGHGVREFGYHAAAPGADAPEHVAADLSAAVEWILSQLETVADDD